MIGKHGAGMGLLALVCAQAMASPVPDALRRWDARLQQAALASTTQRSTLDPGLAAPSMDHSQRHRLASEDPALLAKWTALEMLDLALRDADVASAPIDLASAQSILLDGPGALGTTCAEPLRIGLGQILRIDSARVGASGYWLEVRAPDLRPLILSTRGSRADLRLAAYADCRETGKPAALEADDNFGLQADLGFGPAHAGQFWRVHVTTLGDGEGVLSLLGGELIRGRVTRESDGQGIANIGIAAFNAAGGYVGSQSVAGDGTYQLPLYSGPGTYFVRTGQYYAESQIWLHEAYGGAYCGNPDWYYLSSCTVGVLAPITVPDGGITQGIDIALGPGGSLRGRVVDGLTGVSVPGATVDVYGSTGQSVRRVFADLAGRYRIGGLLPGAVRVSATASTHRGEVYDDIPCALGNSCPVLVGQLVPIALGAEALAEFALEPWSTVAATVDFGPSSGYGAVVVTDSNGAQVAAASVGGSGQQLAVVGPLQPGDYRAYFRGEAQRFSQVHGGIDCIGYCAEQLLQGTPIVISGYGHRVGIGFVPRSWPKVTGVVTDAVTGEPAGGVQVQLVQSFYPVESRTTVGDGRYAIAMPPGSYVVHAGAAEYVNQAYPGVACESPYPPEACVGATTIVSDLQAADRIWNFSLQRSARISGRLTRMGQPIAYDAYVRPLNPARLPIDGTTLLVSANDRYTVLDIPPGNYTFGAVNYASYAQLYPGIDCPPPTNFVHAWSGCNHAAAPVRSLANGEAVDGIDFDLHASGARRGRVVRADTLAPIPGVAIDVWSVQGDRLEVAVSDANGEFSAGGINSGTYALSSDAPGPYIDQVYDGIACPNGSAYEGQCALTGATYVPLPNNDPAAPLLEFRLAPIDPIFANAFD